MNKQLKYLFFLSFSSLFLAQATYSSEKPSLIMGYKEGSKPPYIGVIGNNNGAYQALFSQAAQMIGYQLKIIRLPKKRVYQQLKQGQIDFYPASGFSLERSEYLYWLPNGFRTKQALLSTITDREITGISQMKGTLLAPLGSIAANYATNNPTLKIQKMGVLPIDKAILALQLGRGNFYIYDIDIFDYYLKRKKLESFEQISLRLHPDAIVKEFSSLHAAFSIHSKHFSAIANPNYKTKEENSFSNQKLIPSKDSIAYSFEQALRYLEETGETKKIYNKHFK
jgi:ABC-type amino acid transport substrate-binding protein